MDHTFGRRPFLLGAAAAGLGVALPALAPSTADAATPRGIFGPQLAFLNHTYTVFDRATADAVAQNAYLKQFGNFQLRTTTNGQQTYTGRYLLGRSTYLEMFGEGDLPAPDDQRGASGLAVSPDHAGDIDKVKAQLIKLGVAKPFEFTQTKVIDGAPVPWFRVVAAADTYQAAFPWVMEYLESYLDDPRVHAEPASYPGDVSRERALPDDYQSHLMRDVIGVEIGMPAADVDKTELIVRAAGFTVLRQGSELLAAGGATGIVVQTTARADAGWRKIVFALNRAPGSKHVETIGHSSLSVGPEAKATWTFG